MGKLIYSMFTSLDGYVADEDGGFDWAAPDEEVHAYANALASSVDTDLYGRRMYETMVYWETAHTDQDLSPVERAWARGWRAARKVVYSRTLAEPRSERTTIERTFDPAAVRRLKAEAEGDLAVSGPELAAHALRGGLVDEVQPIVSPVIVGGGKRFLPEGVRLRLELVEERGFAGGMVALRYAVRR